MPLRFLFALAVSISGVEQVKRRYWPAIVPLLLLAGLALRPPTVSPLAIEQSVVRTPELLERAWKVPVAATYQHEVAYQSDDGCAGQLAWPMPYVPYGNRLTPNLRSSTAPVHTSQMG